MAHEGNPKESEPLSISGGSALSSATLTVEVPFVPPEDPGVPPPQPPSSDCNCSSRVLGNPCMPTDYMEECAYAGGLDFDPYAPWEFDGCNNTGGRFVVQAGGVHLISGSGAPLAGYTLYFGGVNENAAGFEGQAPDNQTLHITNYSGRIFNNVIGQPIVGMAINVEPESSCSDFTGLVLMFDWAGDRIILGNYSNANLTQGDVPTIIQQMSPIPDDLQEIVFNNGTPDGGPFIIEVFLIGAVSTNEYWTTSAQSAVGDIVGMGWIFAGNPTTPNPLEDHSVDIVWDANSAIILRWND